MPIRSSDANNGYSDDKWTISARIIGQNEQSHLVWAGDKAQAGQEDLVTSF